MANSIFNEGGAVIAHGYSGSSKEAFIRLNGSHKALFCNAPVTGISVVRSSDYNITRTPSGAFQTTVFGEAPVQITISGMSIVPSLSGCGGADTGSGRDTVDEFFEDNAIGLNPDATVDLDICMSHNSYMSYKCILTDMSMQCRDGGMPNIMATYSMTLLGVVK